MDRIRSTEGTSVVQQSAVQKKTQLENEQTTRVQLEEDLTSKQQQSLAMVQIMLHVSVSSRLLL